MLGRLAVSFAFAAVTLCLAAERPAHPIYESAAAVQPAGKIDELVFADLKRRNLQPARLSSDSVFLRRAYLDVIGTLPTAAEASAFLEDADPNRRARLIDRLLNRDEFAEYWALKWADILRVKAEFPINLWPQAAEGYHRWIRTSLRANKPYDRFVDELLTSSGSNFRVPPVNFYRALQSREPRAFAQAAALTFMGERAEKWPEQRLASMAVFFSSVGFKSTGEWKEEIVYFDQAAKPPPEVAAFPDGTRAKIVPGQDPREAFAAWLTGPGRQRLSRAVVNRIWAWLLGRGIVHEPDDIRPDNPPANPELLDYLERELRTARFDLKHIYRLILNSATYQLSSIPAGGSPEAASRFAHYPVRRLDAEVLADALCQVTGTYEQYSSAIPEPYTILPDGRRSISLPDGSITSSFLELFGRPPRDTGLETERTNRLTAAQRLHLLNSSHVQRKIEQGPALRRIMQEARRPADVVNLIYLTVLSRKPVGEELKAIAAYSQSAPARRAALVDLVWALLNSTEFLYRH